MKRLALFLSIIFVFLDVSIAAAQSGGGYDLSWSVIAGGGGSSSGGTCALAGTIGQTDAGALSGATYALAGGFRAGGSSGYRVYLPLIVK